MALVIGHHGAGALAAENTLKGIRAAKLCKADYVELDVRLSRDGELVLMHDESVDRTTDGKGLVEGLDLVELKAIHAGGEAVPTLSEAVALAKELDLGLVVEMREEGLEALVAEVLSGSRSIVTSCYHASLCEIKDISNLMTGIIITSLPIKPVQPALWARADAIFPERVNPRLSKRRISRV